MACPSRRSPRSSRSRRPQLPPLRPRPRAPNEQRPPANEVSELRCSNFLSFRRRVSLGTVLKNGQACVVCGRGLYQLSKGCVPCHLGPGGAVLAVDKAPKMHDGFIVHGERRKRPYYHAFSDTHQSHRLCTVPGGQVQRAFRRGLMRVPATGSATGRHAVSRPR